MDYHEYILTNHLEERKTMEIKTGTITFHAPNNNGSFYQAYALQNVLVNKFGLNNQIIDYQTTVQIHQYSLFRPVHCFRDIVKNIISLLHYKKLMLHHHRFDEARRKYLNVSKRCRTMNEVRSVANQYNVVIAGSDQIWNTEAPDFSDTYFLPDVPCRKVAYAVSLGSVSKDSQLMNYIKDIASFDYISVREKDAKEYLEEKIKRSVEVNIDPTLLLDKDDYAAFIDSTPLVNEEYIFFYSISYPKEVLQIAKEMSRRMGLKIVTVFTSFHTIMCESYGIKVYYDAGPKEFLNLLTNAKVVLTNSFHGVAFSIIMNKPFYHLCESKGGMIQRDDRIGNLLEVLNIKDRSVGANMIPIVEDNIDWNMIYEERNCLKEKALMYLKTAIVEC